MIPSPQMNGNENHSFLSLVSQSNGLMYINRYNRPIPNYSQYNVILLINKNQNDDMRKNSDKVT